MRRRTALATALGALLLTALPTVAVAEPGPAPHVGAPTVPEGSFALAGTAAERFEVPRDARLVHRTTYADGRTSSRYQQVVAGIAVLGGQLTVGRSAGGENQTVVGAHFRLQGPANDVELKRGDAEALVRDDIGASGTWTTELRLDPRTRLAFYEVRSQRGDRAPVRWLDAESGRVLRSFDAVRTGEGTGVKGDRKVFGTSSTTNGHLLRTPDQRQSTYDDRNGQPGQPQLMRDANDRWDRVAAWLSPDQRAGVDAHYYAGIVDRFYSEVFNRNSLDDEGMPLASIVHVDRNLCNAFWDGTASYFGDGNTVGDKPTATGCLPLSGALDVVAHEFTHGITQFTSRLYAGPESIKLNEGFSDIMGAAVEFFAAEHGLDPAAPADWRFGEDVVAPASSSPGFRNLADPGEDGSLDHYSEIGAPRPAHDIGTIAGHSFFLATVGGLNRGCSATAARPVTHTADCTVVVPGLGIERTQRIYYEAFTSLQENAGFCDARNASVAVAGADASAIDLAWSAVGVHQDCAPTPPPPPPVCADTPNATVPFESAHPYADDSDCTWTFDNGSPGFAFHFSDLSVEHDYDFLVVRDGNGQVLGVYTGDFGPDAPLTCIPTRVGKVQLVTDGFVVDRGFVVDAVVPC